MTNKQTGIMKHAQQQNRSRTTVPAKLHVWHQHGEKTNKRKTRGRHPSANGREQPQQSWVMSHNSISHGGRCKCGRHSIDISTVFSCLFLFRQEIDLTLQRSASCLSHSDAPSMWHESQHNQTQHQYHTHDVKKKWGHAEPIFFVGPWSFQKKKRCFL